MRDRVATAARARRAHERADRAQEELARERVLAERLKAARELHDVVGHAVTVISLQAAVAARYATRDLTAARKAAATVLDVAGDAERELAALGQLLESEPPPVAALEDVIARVRDAGVPVTLVERLDDVELAAPALADRRPRRPGGADERRPARGPGADDRLGPSPNAAPSSSR